MENPVEDIWKIFGNKFGEIDKWMSIIGFF